MASRGSSPDGHLDATGDREVVYCHACAHEWYRDEHGLICPSCQGEITEIVSPDNDPRQLHDNPSSGSSPEFHLGRYHDDDDSDPEVPDIEEHLRGEHGFVYNRDTRQGPGRTHHNPGMEPVFQRFLDMINGFNPPGIGGPPQSARHPYPPNPNDDLDDLDDLPPPHPYPPQQQQHPPDNFPEPLRIHMTTFRRGVFGRGNTSVTIVTGPAGPRGNAPPINAGADPFQELFSNVLRDIGPPEGDNNHPGGPPGTFLRSLHEIIGLLNPANAMAGDAVYSQEALDRIISNLMEANPQSNAAPPASEEALAKLERRPVSKDMLSHEFKTDCSICIDDIKEGDMALFLPCKHWFHEDCVVLWLKEHNTCPICRTPVETNERQSGQGGGDGSASDHSPNNSRGGDQPGAGAAGPSQAGPSRWFTVGFGGPPGGGAAAGGSTSNLPHGDLGLRPSPSTRPPSYRNSRLNEAIRNVTSTQGRQRERDREQGRSSSVDYDTSRLQRRNSMSPTSPRQAAPGDAGSRVRQRSPSQSSTRWAASDQAESNQSSQRQSGRGPLSWIRDRLPGGGGSNNGSSRHGDQP